MNIVDTIKYRFKHAGIVEKLIYINLVVFIATFLSGRLSPHLFNTENILFDWLALPADLDELLKKPWTLLSFGFLHENFIHLFLNLVSLFFIGNLFKQYFTSKQLLNFYILGTTFGGVLFLLMYNSIPALEIEVQRSILLGASAGITAIFIGIATYLPNYQVKIPLIGFVKLWILAAIWMVLDLIQLPIGNTGGRLAHLGGALFGFFYVYYASNKEITLFQSFGNLFKKKKKSPLKTVYNSGKKPSGTFRTRSKSKTQQEIDAILDKISKSGYETLSPEEKEFLFKQGKN